MLETKKELVEKYVKIFGGTKSDAETAINNVVEVMQAAVAEDGGFKIVGAFTITAKERKERTGRNPKTGESIKIPASRVVSFKVGAKFKERVAGK